MRLRPLSIAVLLAGTSVLPMTAATGSTSPADRTTHPEVVVDLLAPGPTVADPTRRRAPYPTTQTFKLHSLPGAQRTIFLDVDGGTVSGTEWNKSKGLPDGAYVGFSIDGDPSTWTPREHTAIQEIWQVVAEDFAPFQVDVTTEQPRPEALDRADAQDQVYGTTALVTGSQDAAQQLCQLSCAGIAFLGVFDDETSHALYQPAFIFAGQISVDEIGDALSHEIGHTFGLRHDGDAGGDYSPGAGAKAAIMGRGFGFNTWSNGDYPGATNQEDDVAIIAASGAPLRLDDVGDEVGTARELGDGVGLISTRTDVDVFRLGQCDGLVEVSAAPTSPFTNLGVGTRLLDESGAELAVGTPDRYLSRDLASTLKHEVTGTAYLEVDGVGTSAYSDYGVLGGYRVSAQGCNPTGAPLTPGLPADVELRYRDERTLELRWVPPSSGPEVTGYVVSQEGRALSTTKLPAKARSYSFGGLVYGTTYTFTVAAVNAAGQGRSVTVSGAPDGARTTTAPVIGAARPGKPGGARTATVTWAAPSTDYGYPVSGYVVHAVKIFNGYEVGAKTFPATPSAARSLVVTLPAGSWKFYVVALNAGGESARSKYTKLVTGR
ncbi:MAG: hypothetical protein F2667_05565 [Actinobacteria bacterium]|uniref:Unannotated protein n=1 Tax=freshwater metagenome TaxID=449393 RepID=A0A6J6PUT9_9ZZZZ|nr:hypothetical protein [Actinomycetota bacterium]